MVLLWVIRHHWTLSLTLSLNTVAACLWRAQISLGVFLLRVGCRLFGGAEFIDSNSQNKLFDWADKDNNNTNTPLFIYTRSSCICILTCESSKAWRACCFVRRTRRKDGEEIYLRKLESVGLPMQIFAHSGILLLGTRFRFARVITFNLLSNDNFC